MPATLFYILSLFLLILIFSGVLLYLRHAQKKKQAEYESRISRLEQDLAATGARAQQQLEHLKTIEGTTEYEKYAGLALAQTDLAVVIIDKNGIVKFVNDRAEPLLDLAAAAGSSYKDVIHVRAAGGGDNFAPFEAAFAGHVAHLSDASELTGPHGTIPVIGTVVPLMEDSTVTAVVFIFEDSSKQVARVKEERAFFSAAAHELRTPLTVIRMTVSLLLEKFGSLPKEKIMEHLRRTDETAEKLVKLVNDFLNISRIDQGRLEIHTEKFDMVALTDEVIANLALLAKERSLYLNHEIAGTQRMVAGDRAKAAEILSNIIGNGLKYTVKGGLTIAHTTVGGTLSTTITDTGTGIPKESQSLLFKRFGQIGEARAQQSAKSTGLGLYISKKLALLMHGDVTLVKSEPGMGSTFMFTLPLG
ncbi:hypothetical protein A2363_00830 [Candidatus Gottesmanbacteria bacterium RIFOXYB1_FULL_47_11]|uniref:histidine kinase n=1 Tax=Candidatus Gottesmanbacteria bacterium RIFOXYB1_FULL_47_11 TaxID=1798401 RepID=A0A1F6BGS1_9BACT|nr:MAG: hypothetical protein A2363_00830 [Candidatus Gottesmanbacteria bacterium RIFOXYB1_FULL_47_11]